MATGRGGLGFTDRIVRQAELLVRVQGTGAVHDLNNAIQANQTAQGNLAGAYQRGRVHLDEYLHGVRALRTAEIEYITVQEAVYEKIRTGTIVLQDNMRARSAAARSVLEFSRGFEDFVAAGPIGALNNVPTLVYSIGQSLEWSATKVSAITAGVSLAATAVYALWRNWDQVVKAFDSGEGAITTVSDRLEALKKNAEDLEKKPFKLRADIEELEAAEEKYKKLLQYQKDYEQGFDKQTELERESGKAILEALDKSGLGEVGARRRVQEEYRVEQEAARVEPLKVQAAFAEHAAVEAFKMGVGGVDLARMFERSDRYKAAAEQVRNQIAQEAQIAVGRIFSEGIGGGGPEQARAQADMGRLLGGSVGRRIGDLGPAGIQADRDAEAEAKAMKETMERGDKRQKRMDERAAKELADQERQVYELDDEANRRAAKDLADQEKAQRELDQDAARQQREADRARKAQPRLSRQQFEEDLTADFKAMGAEGAQARALAKKTMSLISQGFHERVAAEEAILSHQRAQAKALGRGVPSQRDVIGMQVAQEFAARGATDAQALAMARRTLTLMSQGVNVQKAMAAAQRQQEAFLLRLEREVSGLRNEVQRHRQAGSSRTGTRIGAAGRFSAAP